MAPANRHFASPPPQDSDLLPGSAQEEDLALGWESAAPALQIEGWGEASDPKTGAEFH